MSINTYKLTNKNGMIITVTNVGCAIIKWEVPDKSGKLVDIVQGLDCAEDYATKPHPHFGVVCGRVANRIANATFTLSGKTYKLEENDGKHHLHGGEKGFCKYAWDVAEATDNKLVFTLHSPDGDSGYPGNLDVRVTYTLTDENTLRMDYYAETDSETICNLTNHSYFNLNGHTSTCMYDHELEIMADKITAIDADLITNGEYMDVAGTPFDFRTPKTIGQDIDAADKFSKTGGYDHNYVLRAPGKAASAYAPSTGIRMTVSTNSPGIQLYTGNFLAGTQGKGATYNKHSGFCLETQFFPDGINKPHFPSCIVTKGNPQEFYTEFKVEVAIPLVRK